MSKHVFVCSDDCLLNSLHRAERSKLLPIHNITTSSATSSIGRRPSSGQILGTGVLDRTQPLPALQVAGWPHQRSRVASHPSCHHESLPSIFWAQTEMDLEAREPKFHSPEDTLHSADWLSRHDAACQEKPAGLQAALAPRNTQAPNSKYIGLEAPKLTSIRAIAHVEAAGQYFSRPLSVPVLVAP